MDFSTLYVFSFSLGICNKATFHDLIATRRKISCNCGSPYFAADFQAVSQRFSAAKYGCNQIFYLSFLWFTFNSNTLIYYISLNTSILILSLSIGCVTIEVKRRNFNQVNILSS